MSLVVFLVLVVCALAVAGCGSTTTTTAASGATTTTAAGGTTTTGGGAVTTTAPATGTTTAPSGGTVKLGAAGPYTGAIAQTGEMVKKAMQLAEEQCNAAGGINGKKLVVDYLDDKADPKEAAVVANKLAADASILGVVGHYNSSCTLAGAPIYAKAKVTELSYGSTSPAVTDAGPYTFRNITTDAYDGAFVAQWTFDEGYKKIAILYENNDYGLGLANVYAAKIKALGGQVVMQEPYQLGETKDFSALLTKMKGLSPDALFIAGEYNESAMIIKQGIRLGLKPPVFGSNGLYSDALIQLGGADVEGVRVIGAFIASSASATPEAKAFIDAFTAKYGSAPDIWGAFAYDAMNLMIDAVKNAGESRDKINAWMTTVKDWKGATGITTFDANGDCLKEPLKLVIKDGKFQLYTK